MRKQKRAKQQAVVQVMFTNQNGSFVINVSSWKMLCCEIGQKAPTFPPHLAPQSLIPVAMITTKMAGRSSVIPVVTQDKKQDQHPTKKVAWMKTAANALNELAKSATTEQEEEGLHLAKMLPTLSVLLEGHICSVRPSLL